MRLFRVDFQNNVRPPILLRGVTRAQVSRQMKERYGDLFLRVDYISYEDAEAQFGHFDLFKNVKEELNTKSNKYSENYKDNIMFKDQFKKITEVSKNKIYKYLDKSGQEAGHEKDMESASAKRDKGFTNATNKVLGKAKVNATEEYADFITPESELTEEMYFKVNIQGLPDMYMSASSAGMIKAKLRKMLKNMDMIGDIVKTPKADVRKAFRMKAMEGEDSQDESTMVEKISDNEKEISKASKFKSRATVIKAMNNPSVSEDFIENKTKFGKPADEVYEQEIETDESNTVNFTSILTGDNPFYKPIQELSKNTLSSHNEGHDEIQDKNVDGLDDNQKPEGYKTAKQFAAPKNAKSKMKSLKMEMKTDIADLVIEKAKLKKNDLKMRAGKLDPKAMTALKTMSQDEAKVLVQGLPSNLRKSTMKELGIREQDSQITLKKTVESILIKREIARKVEEDSMTDQQNQATKAYNANKKSLTSLHRKAKKGGQVHVDHTDEKGKKQSGRYNGMMRMGAHTYAKIEPHDGKKGGTTLLPIHQAQNIRHVK